MTPKNSATPDLELENSYLKAENSALKAEIEVLQAEQDVTEFGIAYDEEVKKPKYREATEKCDHK